jgi:acyl-[acyl carrier protein]--UDP-N-acetylglucosamine O-acyltransferase
MGEGVVIYQNGSAARGAFIGDHSIINIGAIVSHDTKLGSYATLNPGVNLAGNISVGEGLLSGHWLQRHSRHQHWRLDHDRRGRGSCFRYSRQGYRRWRSGSRNQNNRKRIA